MSEVNNNEKQQLPPKILKRTQYDLKVYDTYWDVGISQQKLKYVLDATISKGDTAFVKGWFKTISHLFLERF